MNRFVIQINLIFWQNIIKVEKLEFALFASMYVRKSRRAFDAYSILSIFWLFYVFVVWLTYFMKLRRSNCIDTKSLKTQYENERFERFAKCQYKCSNAKYYETQTFCHTLYPIFCYRCIISILYNVVRFIFVWKTTYFKFNFFWNVLQKIELFEAQFILQYFSLL